MNDKNSFSQIVSKKKPKKVFQYFDYPMDWT